MSINQITNLVNFYAIKNSKDEEELIKNNLLKTYNKYKNGITGEEILGVILRFGGNLFHMAASVIIYRLSLNRKEKKYIIYFIILFLNHFLGDTFGQFFTLYELSIWFFLIFPVLDIMIIAIGWLVWKENNNKDYADYNFKNNEILISL